MKKIKKITMVALTAALLTTAATLTSYAADLTGLNLSYTSNFRSDHTYEPVSYFQGFYQASSQAYNHNARAGTHYDTGKGVDKGKATVKVYHVGSGENPVIREASGTGWIETPWAEIPNSGITPTKIEFIGENTLYNGDKKTDKITVNK